MVPSRGRACMRCARSDDQPKDLLSRVHACAIGGGKLANAVSQDDVGNDAPGPPQRDEAGLYREQRWLRVGSFVDQTRIRMIAQEYVREWLPQTVAHDLGAAIDFLSEYRLMAIELRRPFARIATPARRTERPAGALRPVEARRR